MTKHPAVAFLLAAHQQAEALAYGGCTPAHFERVMIYGPTALLQRVAAERKLLADLLAERHLVVDGDCWYTCAAATEERDGQETCDDGRRGGDCDCGRDDRVERRVLVLAEAWGWTESVQEQARTEDVPAAYAAARADAARSLRAVEASLLEAAGGAPLRGADALHGMVAEMLERWSPFASAPIRAYDLVAPPAPPPWDGPRTSAGCYAASWGWVHVRPGCRCVR